MHIMCCQHTCLSAINVSNCKLHVCCLHQEAQVVTCHCDASVAWGCLEPASAHVTLRKKGFEETWAVHKPCENCCFQLTKRLLSETVIWTQDCKCMFCAPTHQNLQHEQSNDDFFHGIQFVFDVQLAAHQWWKHRPSMPCTKSHTHFELFANENQKLNVTFKRGLAQNSSVQSSLCCGAQCFCMKKLHAGSHAGHVLVNDCHHNDSSWRSQKASHPWRKVWLTCQTLCNSIPHCNPYTRCPTWWHTMHHHLARQPHQCSQNLCYQKLCPVCWRKNSCSKTIQTQSTTSCQL